MTSLRLRNTASPGFEIVREPDRAGTKACYRSRQRLTPAEIRDRERERERKRKRKQQ